MNTTQKLWCDKHKLQLQNDKSAVPLYAYSLSVEATVLHDRFIKLCSDVKNWDAVNKTLDNITPVCCFLGDGAVDDIIEHSRDCPVVMRDLSSAIKIMKINKDRENDLTMARLLDY